MDARKRKYNRLNQLLAFFIGIIFGGFSIFVWAATVYKYLEKEKKPKKGDEFYKIYKDTKVVIIRELKRLMKI